jgi:hypothetical protein
MTPFQVTRVPGACVHPPGTAGSPPSPEVGGGGRIVHFSKRGYRALSVSLPDC